MEDSNSISGFNFFVSYEFQNVLVYFMIIPLIWAVVIDWKWIKRPYFTAALIVLVLSLIVSKGGIQEFTTWIFVKGVRFCAYWKKYGYSYAEACIVWCIMYPMLFSILLTVIPARKRKQSAE